MSLSFPIHLDGNAVEMLDSPKSLVPYVMSGDAEKWIPSIAPFLRMSDRRSFKCGGWSLPLIPVAGMEGVACRSP
ncbi:unnamed protein product [Tuwongella immobilis]|uniref:Uncharacterized protein n=1 Tax=Tuwongella immobilis TaxID=692036 RepID=A0A6C2YRX8_9BACT|nr:unnamed protein product [Tuwongella immobilis]VTS05133.1 unnamed protein product [Tuwongella immobilis]